MAIKDPNDKILINRSGVSYQAPINMESLMESDLILVNRSGSSYKLTAGQWKEMYGGIAPGGGQFDVPTPVLTAEFPNVDQTMKLTVDLSSISSDAKDPVYVLATFVTQEGDVVSQRQVIDNETFIPIPPTAKDKTIYASVLFIDSTTPAPQQALRNSNTIGPIGDILFTNLEIDVSPTGNYSGNKRVVGNSLPLPAKNDDQIWVGVGWCKGGKVNSDSTQGEPGENGSGVWFIKNQPLNLLVSAINQEGGITGYTIVNNGIGYNWDSNPYTSAAVTTKTGSGTSATLEVQRVDGGNLGEYTAVSVSASGNGYAVGDEICYTRSSDNEAGSIPNSPDNLFDDEVDVLIWGAGGGGGRNGNLNGPQNCNNCASGTSGGAGRITTSNGTKGGNACGRTGGAGGVTGERNGVRWTNGGNAPSRAGGGGGGFPGGKAGQGEAGCSVGAGGGGGAGYVSPDFNNVTESSSQLGRIILRFSAEETAFFDATANIGSPYMNRLVIGDDIQLPSN